MKSRIFKIAAALLAIALIAWIASKTSFVETTVPMPLKGEAASNPFYAAQRLAEELRAEAKWERVFTSPPTDSVVVLSAWNWSLSRPRRERLQRWVEGGGRLVVDRSLIGDTASFAEWSGIVQSPRISETDEAGEEFGDEQLREIVRQGMPDECSTLTDPTTQAQYSVCDIDRSRLISTTRKPLWSLRDAQDTQVVRTAVGRGSVTLVNAQPFHRRELFRGDHATLFVRAAQLHRGDEVLFLTEVDHPSLLTLAWRFGAPVIVIGFALVALALWRASARFGPLLAPPEKARRSLAEQIRGTGQFALRFGGGESLHAATVRALRDAAAREIPGYDRLSSVDRIAALGRATGLRDDDLGPALHYSGARNSHELRDAIAVLETARRRLLMHKRSPHGN